MNDENDLMAGARKIVSQCLAIKKDESIVIVADIPNKKAADALYFAVAEKQAEPSIMLMSPRNAHGQDPPGPIAKAMCSCDAAILATTYSLSNSPARRKACNAGVRIISIPGCEERVLKSGGIDADFLWLEPGVRETGLLLAGTKNVNIKSECGTDIEIKLCGRPSVDQTGLSLQPGQWSPFPLIETAVGPKEDSAKGIIVVDGVIIPGGSVTDLVTITVERGKIVNIQGGSDADNLRKTLEGFGHPNVYCLVELGLGLNPCSSMGRGLMAEDESQYGTVHFGFGDGQTFGVDVSAPGHFDVVLAQPTVTLDDQLLLSQGKYHLGPFSKNR